MSKPSAARSGSTAATPRKPPHERGNSSYQAPKRARSRSTSIRSTALLTALLRLRCESACAANRHSSTVPSPKSTRPSDSSPLRSAWPAADLAIVLVEPARVGIDPGLDPELPGAERVGRDARLEVVVPHRLERRLAPPSRSDGPEAHDALELVVAVAEDRGADRDRVAEARLDRKTAAVDLRLDVLDLDSLRLHPRQGKQSGDVALPFRRRQPPSDLAAGRPARARGVRVRRLAGRRGSALLAGAAAQSTRRLRLSVRLRLGVRELARPPRRPGRRRRAVRAPPLRGGATRTGSATGSRSREATRWPTRCGSSASGRLCARTPPSAACGSSATCRSTSPRAAATTPRTPSSSSPTATSRARRPTRSTSCGQKWGNPLYDWDALVARGLPLVDRAPAPDARPLRRVQDRPLPGLRRLLGCAGEQRRPARGTGRAAPGRRSSSPPSASSARCR